MRPRLSSPPTNLRLRSTSVSLVVGERSDPKGYDGKSSRPILVLAGPQGAILGVDMLDVCEPSRPM